MSLSKAITRNGALLSAAVFVLMNVAAPTAQGQIYQEKVLHSFNGDPGGASPEAGLVRDPAGNLYGTTPYGGAYKGGTVFKVAASGVESVLYNFCSQSRCTDGARPFAGLVRDSMGNLYGTTQYGGDSYAGTVFKLSASGVESVLYSFCSQSGCADGEYPVAGLVRDSEGNLYGTTQAGGASGYYHGTVFKVSAGGVESVLYNFCSRRRCADGENPYAGLVRDPADNLYGTTFGGGAAGVGTVFEVSANGVESVLYSFGPTRTSAADGASPFAGLVRDAAGNLYGTTYYGGASDLGTVFKLVPRRSSR
jgi:uncharacterized repeat protein (TIGR03803 family)